MIKQVIEHAGIPVGIVIPSGNHLRFIAVKFHVYELDGHLFTSPSDVLRAIHQLMSDCRGNAAPPRAA